MTDKNIWNAAKQVCIQTSDNIAGNFDVGFDSKIPEQTKNELRAFVSWVEQSFNIPVTLWVDFEYRHYLIRRDGERVGYLFYWSDFEDYPNFHDGQEIPTIRLPVRTEHYTMDEILTSFIEAITYYFAWICNVIDDDFEPDEYVVEQILQEYLNSK